MKGETQSVHLQKMMQSQKHHPEYTLLLAPIAVKRKSMNHLQRGDILLLGLDHLELYLQNAESICAKVGLSSRNDTVKIEIESLEERPVESSNSKKYETVLCTFGTIRSRTLEKGHVIEISSADLHEVTLFREEKKQAAGLLVNAEDEIAIEITEVYNG